ncbi:tyrosine-type recombinase/integrase [Alicyclobacillus sp. ALC3]|nr:tyrosine-type recombinase/integrase [Alicyclobacillus sp. ALC3]
MRNALRWAVQWQILTHNPADTVALPRIEKKQARPLSPEEAARFLEACAYDEYGPLFQLLLFTGLRPGEATALRWCDLDLEQHVVYVRRTYTKKVGQELISSQKTKQGPRGVPLLDTN